MEAEVKGRFAGYDVTFTGRLSKPALASVLMESDVCLYPCNFFETFCLTALECQAAGVPVVTSEFGALATTLAPGAGVKIPGIRIRRHIAGSSCGRRWTCCRTLSGGGPWVRPAWYTWPAGRSVGWTWRSSGGGWSGDFELAGSAGVTVGETGYDEVTGRPGRGRMARRDAGYRAARGDGSLAEAASA